jgi:hypothetical protein
MWRLLLVCIRNYRRGWTLHAARVMHFSVHHEDIRRQQASVKAGTLGDENSDVGLSLGNLTRSDTVSDVKVHGR